MTTATVIARRNGRVTLRVPCADIRDDGTVWYKGNPILDSQAAGGLSKADMIPLVKAQRWADIPACNYARMGSNPSGLILADEAEELAEARREADRYLAEHPEVAERAEITRLYEAAYRSEHHDTDDNQMMRACQQRARANKLLAAWREKYPEAARAEKAAELRSQAADRRRLAVGALVYDCDGSLTAEMQQERHDSYMRDADELERQAARI